MLKYKLIPAKTVGEEAFWLIEWRYFRFYQIQDGGWPPFSNGHISATGRPIDFVFDPRVGFSGTADRMDLQYFWLDQIQDGGWPTYWKISNGHISATGHPIHFAFGIGFSRSADRMALFPVGPNPRSRPSAV